MQAVADAGVVDVAAPVLTENAVRVLENRYLIRDASGIKETPAQLFRRVADAVAAAEPEETRKAWSDRFYDLMRTGSFMPNSPTLMNAGRNNHNTMAACYVLPVPDNTPGIFDSIKTTAIVQKAGGGVGFAFDGVRPCGAIVSTSGGMASGPISFWRVFCEATNAIQQGCVAGGTLLYAVHPETGVQGLYPIKDLVGEDRQIFTFSADAACFMAPTSTITPKASIVQTGSQVEVWKLRTSSGLELVATPEHLIRLYAGRDVPLSELRSGDRLMSFDSRAVVGQRPAHTPEYVVSVEPFGVDDVYDATVPGADYFVVFKPSENDEHVLGIAIHNSFRRGANMGMMRVDYPDIIKFLFAKQDLSQFTNYNISVKVSDAWMNTVRDKPDTPHVVTWKDQSWLIPRSIVERCRKAVRAGIDGSGAPRDLDTCYKLGDLIEITGVGLDALESPGDVLTVGDVMQMIVQHAWQTGEPGLAFMDRIRETEPTPHVGLIEASNPCVTGETLVAVADGRGCVPIEELAKAGLDVPVHCVDPKTGEAHVRWGRNPRMTRRQVPVLKVTLDDGSSIRTTPDHKFLLRSGEAIPASDLGAGDSLLKFNRYQQPNSSTGNMYWYVMNRAERGRRNNCPEHNIICRLVHGDPVGDQIPHHINEDSLDNRPENLEWLTIAEHNRIHPQIVDVAGEKNPRYGAVLTEDTKSKIGAKSRERFANDPAFKKKHAEAIRASWTEERRDALRKLKTKRIEFACQTCGKTVSCRPSKRGQFCSKACSSASHIITMSDEEMLALGSECIVKMKKLTWSNWRWFKKYAPNRPDSRVLSNRFGSFEQFKERVLEIHNHKVASVVPDGVADVYNITVDEFHTVAYVTNANHRTRFKGYLAHNGVYTRQCGEQFLLALEACNLGSVALDKYVTPFWDNFPNITPEAVDRLLDDGVRQSLVDWDRLASDVFAATRFLDNVVTVGAQPTPEIDAICKANRKIGLGVMGFADALIRLGVQYDSPEGLKWGERFMDFVNRHAISASRDLAAEKGPFANFKGSRWDREGGPPIRNADVTTVAPTGTISILANCSGGMEPLFSPVFMRQVLGGQRLPEYNANFKALATRWGFLSPDLDEYIFAGGSLQGRPDVPVAAQRLFRTARDIDVDGHIMMQSVFQKCVSNATSKCVVGDTRVLTDKGYVKIVDLAQHPGEDDSFSPLEDVRVVLEDGRSVAAESFYRGGERETVRVTTETGRVVEGTLNHPLRVFCRESGELVWRKMEDLTNEDYVAAVHDVWPNVDDPVIEDVCGPWTPKPRRFGNRFKWPKTLTPELAFLMGYYHADGSMTANSVCLSAGNDKLAKMWLAALESVFGIPASKVSVIRDNRREHLYCYSAHGRDLVAFFKYLGLAGRAYEKRFPELIFRASRASAFAYVQGLAKDGYVNTRQSAYVYYGTSRHLAESLVQVTTLLGYPSSLQMRAVVDGTCDSAFGCCLDSMFVGKFVEDGGFIEDHKAEAAATLSERRHARGSFYAPFTPKPESALREEKATKAKTSYEYRFLGGLAGHKRKFGTRVAQQLRDLGIDIGFDVSHVLMDRVARIERGRARVYDLHVPDEHRFVGNGIVNHNTINMLSSAPVDEVRRAYLLAHERRCKGVTIYRDGCRAEQPMALKSSVKGATPTPPAIFAAPVSVPDLLLSVRTRYKSTYGNLHIHVSLSPTPDGRLRELEVFFHLGRSGDGVHEMIDVYARLASMILRLGGRLETVVDQLRGHASRAEKVNGQTGGMTSLPSELAMGLVRYLEAVSGVRDKDGLLLRIPEQSERPKEAVVTRYAGPAGNGHNGSGNGDTRQFIDRVVRSSAVAGTLRQPCPTPGCAGELIWSEGCRMCMTCLQSSCS